MRLEKGDGRREKWERRLEKGGLRKGIRGLGIGGLSKGT